MKRASMIRASKLVLGLLFSAACVQAQGPPAGLPQLLFTCDIPATGQVCGTWNWKDGAYEGRWTNSTVGKLTVLSSSGGSLVVERRDTIGNAAGIVASYTGKWDGKSINDGKVTWKLGAQSGTSKWTASLTPSKDGLPLTLGRFHNNIVINWYPSDLIAYSLEGGDDDHAPGHQIDSLITGDPPVPAYNFGVVSGSCKDCPYIWPQMSVEAGIFADGNAMGNPGDVTILIQNRAKEVAAYKTISGQLAALAAQHLDLPDIIAGLRKEYPFTDSNQPGWTLQKQHAFNRVSDGLNAGAKAHVPAETQVAKTQADIQGVIGVLSVPVNVLVSAR